MSKQEETPLSKLLFYQKGKEVKTHVRTLLTLRNTSAAQTVRFIDLEMGQPSQVLLVPANETLFGMAAKIAQIFTLPDVEILDSEDEASGGRGLIETDAELERLLAGRLAWESACREDVLEASLETIRSMLLSSRPEPQTHGCFALWTLARDTANHVYVRGPRPCTTLLQSTLATSP